MKAREQERNAHKKAALQLWEQQMKTEKERARKREAKSLRMKRDAARTTARITRQHMLRRAERVQGDASKARNFGLRLLNGVISLSAQVVTVLAAGGVPSKGQSLPRSVRLRFCSVMGAVAKCQEGAENAKCNEQAGVGNADENICILLGNSGGAVFAAMYVVGRVPACRAGGRRPRTLPIYEWQPWDTGAAGGLIAENAFRDYLEASKDMQVCSEYRRICPEKYRPDPMKVTAGIVLALGVSTTNAWNIAKEEFLGRCC